MGPRSEDLNALAESLAMTRVRRGDADYSRYTGNLLYLSVIHEDAWPVGSDVPDPMVHAHNYIFNLSWDEEEGLVWSSNTGCSQTPVVEAHSSFFAVVASIKRISGPTRDPSTGK